VSKMKDVSAEVPGAGAPRADLDETPPVLGSWRAIYAFVLGSQAALVVLFLLVTRACTP